METEHGGLRGGAPRPGAGAPAGRNPVAVPRARGSHCLPRVRVWASCLLLAAAACTATVDGGELSEADGTPDDQADPPGRDPGDEDPADDPLVPGDDDGVDDPPPAPPPGPAGTCWGAIAFDPGCSRERAATEWSVVLFPGDSAMAAMVSTTATDNAAIVSFGPAGAASSARWSDTLVAMLPGQAGDGRIGALRLVVPAAAQDSMDVVHAKAASTRESWRTGWQDAPTGILAPGFATAHREVDGQLLDWEAAAIAGGVELRHSVEVAGVAHEHTIEIGAAGATGFGYRRLEAGIERESWSSDDGRLWHPAGGGADDDLGTEGEQLAWPVPLPQGFAADGIEIEARHASWGRELGWLQGQFAGLAVPLLDGFASITDLWVDVDAATVRSLTVMFWDGTSLHEWDASEGSLVDDQEFPASYQTDRGSRVEVRSDGQVLASVEALAEESQVRIIARDMLVPGAESIATAFRWEVVFESHDALPTGEVAVQRTDESGCTRQLSYDFGASWVIEACE